MAQKPEDVIGPAAVKALADAGYTLTPPKEPARLVRMEESRGRYEEFALGGGWETWSDGTCLPSEEWRQRYNAADDWLVKTVNRRIIGGLPVVLADYEGLQGFRPFEYVQISTGHKVGKLRMLELFCGDTP